MNKETITELVKSYSTAILSTVEKGHNPVDAFTIIICENKAVHLHSAYGVSKEYLAVMIDVMEWALSEMNNPQNSVPPIAEIFVKEIYYRELLMHYIAHVSDCEGISFIDRSSHLNIELTNDETTELSKLEKEASQKYY